MGAISSALRAAISVSATLGGLIACATLRASSSVPTARSSSLRKNLETEPMFLSDEGRVLAMDRALVPSIGRGLRRDQFGDADQIVGDQVKQEIGSNSGDAAVLGLTHCTVLFAPAED